MDAFIFAPQCVKEVYAKRDAMRAGTSHYSYASSYHDLLSGCKDKNKFNTFQTFRQIFSNYFIFTSHLPPPSL